MLCRTSGFGPVPVLRGCSGRAGRPAQPFPALDRLRPRVCRPRRTWPLSCGRPRVGAEAQSVSRGTLKWHPILGLRGEALSYTNSLILPLLLAEASTPPRTTSPLAYCPREARFTDHKGHPSKQPPQTHLSLSFCRPHSHEPPTARCPRKRRVWVTGLALLASTAVNTCVRTCVRTGAGRR